MFSSFLHGFLIANVRAAERIQRHWSEKEEQAPLRAKRAENLQGLETSIIKLLLEPFGVMRPLVP